MNEFTVPRGTIDGHLQNEHERNMHEHSQNEYRTEGRQSTALVRDTQPRALCRIESKRAIQRQTHDLVVRVTDDGVDGPHADWWYDLRRGKLRIYGGLLRFLDHASKKAPRWVLKMIPGWLDEYIDTLYDAA